MKISAIIPAFNSERTIARALHSVLAQTRPADEIIVVDDGSTDKTADAVRAFGDRVQLITQPNAGVSVARNTGIEAASGDWIAFLDADDEWLPEKLALQAEHLCRHPEIGWIYSNFYQQEDHVSERTVAHRVGPRPGGVEVLDDYLGAYCNHLHAWTTTILVRRGVFETVGWFKPGMKRAQDNDLWFRIAYQYPQVGYVAKPLAVYHRDTPNSSTKLNDDVVFMIDFVRRHEQLSASHGRRDAFGPCITQMVSVWVRALLERHRRQDAARLIKTFKTYLSPRFCREMYFRMYLPVLGPLIADGVTAAKQRGLQKDAVG